MPLAYDNFVKLAMRETAETPDGFLRVKKDICKKLKIQPPTNADIREAYENLITKKQFKRNLPFEKLLISKKMRTDSGVAVIAVLTKPYGCPGKCLYCPTEKNMPKSYLKNEPAVMRAIAAKFNPYIQVQKRIRALELNGHKTDKIELIIMGGTFSFFPKAYQKWFVTECFRGCNEYKNHSRRDAINRVSTATLARQQTRNENAKRRIIGLTLETRPDFIDEKEILNFRNLGCTRVELGVQSILDDVLKLNKRGHNVSETIRATKLLKNAGFKINYHIMPGLYGSDLKKDYKMFQKLFSNQNFQPDMLKIYPTIVLKDSELYGVWKKGYYKALNDKQFEKFILRVKEKIIPPYVRIARLVRDVPAESIIAGPIISNLRQLIAQKSKCRCIRCREVRGNYDIADSVILNRIDYNASGGKEIFLEYISAPIDTRRDTPVACLYNAGNKSKLFALLRLRIPFAPVETRLIASLQNAAIIREVHTYGKMAEINKQDKKSPQHIGLGKKLILEAEKIAREEFGLKKMTVISGIGARNYYRKLGYRLKDGYMVKKI